MSIRLAVRKFEGLADGPKNEKGRMTWARNVCIESRSVHVATWRFCPPRDFVAETALPLLLRAQKKLRELVGIKDLPNEEREKLETYSRNLELRIRNIAENYLHGRPSAFIPDDKLSEPTAKAI
jgi:hypothetical protein